MIELSDFYPSPADLIESEVTVLGHLRNNPYIKEKQQQFFYDANKYYSRNRHANSEFEFHSHFDLWHYSMQRGKAASRNVEPNVRIIISAGIRAKKLEFENVTYCLAVCRLPRMTVMRKFHFDVVSGKGRRSQEHPRFHLQYCGEMVPYMTTLGCRENQLDQMHPWLSEPRIPFSPMALALLIDMALHEFPDQATAKFRRDSYWRNLVRGQEALVLGPFYQKCVDVISGTHGDTYALADAFYVV